MLRQTEIISRGEGICSTVVTCSFLFYLNVGTVIKNSNKINGLMVIAMKISVTSNKNRTIIHMNNFIVTKGLFFKTLKYNKNDDPMPIYIKLLKHFINGKVIFFGFYRTDGINLTNEEWLKYDIEIPKYFQANGRYEPLTKTVEKRGKIKTNSGYFMVGSLPVNEETYKLIPWIFHYYLEITLFCPNIDWGTFVQSYRDYMKHGTSTYIENGYTNFLFTYADSGIFSLEFNQNLFDKNVVYQEIEKILNE